MVGPYVFAMDSREMEEVLGEMLLKSEKNPLRSGVLYRRADRKPVDGGCGQFPIFPRGRCFLQQ